MNEGQRMGVCVTEKHEGKQGRCVRIDGNIKCRYVFKSKKGGKEKLVVTYSCQEHELELLYKDSEGFYLLD